MPNPFEENSLKKPRSVATNGNPCAKPSNIRPDDEFTVYVINSDWFVFNRIYISVAI
jgi:hypothetical protein